MQRAIVTSIEADNYRGAGSGDVWQVDAWQQLRGRLRLQQCPVASAAAALAAAPAAAAAAVAPPPPNHPPGSW